MKKINTICIIDDDPIHIFISKDAIQSADLCENIIEFENGKEAYDNLVQLQKTDKIFPSVILLDLNMPIWDGWDFLDEFSKLTFPEKIVVFISTSSNDPADKRKAEKYNIVDNFIIKPISMDLLTHELENIHKY